MRIPTSLVPGFSSGLSSGDRSKTTVTGPGKRSSSNPSGRSTLPHLKK